MGIPKRLLVLIFCCYECMAIPSSMIEEIKARELRPNKVKRVSMDGDDSGENIRSSSDYYGNPTAIKRGTELKNDVTDQEPTDNWIPRAQSVYQTMENDYPSPTYNDETIQSTKNLEEYDRGFQYGGNREKFDEAIENAVLKSEYYENLDSEKKKRKKRNSRQYRYGNTIASEDLSPEEVLDLLTLYENERQKSEDDLSNLEQDNAVWLDVPVRPGAIIPSSSNIPSPYFLDHSSPNLESRWSDNRNKRFMVAKKRNDPTRELRYLNGPSKHDYYFLSQLLNNRRETNVPVYHRHIL